MNRAKKSSEVDLNVRFARWLRALMREDVALFWATLDTLRSIERVTDREMKVKAFARAYRTATALLDRVRAGTGRGPRVNCASGRPLLAA